jgi:chromatin remodeling complex protein RSC6
MITALAGSGSAPSQLQPPPSNQRTKRRFTQAASGDKGGGEVVTVPYQQRYGHEGKRNRLGARPVDRVSFKESDMSKHVEVDDTNPDAVHQEVNVSPELAKITGEGPMARGEVTSKIWDYIHKNNLQSEDDGREINPDEALAAVVGKARVTMFQMTAKVNEHILAPEKAGK